MLARSRCWFIDSKGLVVKSRTDLADHKAPFAIDQPFSNSALDIIESFVPTALIGVSGQRDVFSEPILRRMAKLNERPIIFALSNPTSMAECTATAAYQYTDGRAVYASGSPFGPVILNGKTFVPGQGNNSYIFPGIGLGVVASGSKRVTQEMFLAAARTLAHEVSEEDLSTGRIYPPLTKIRKVSAAIALATAEVAFKHGLARLPKPSNLPGYILSQMYHPVYPNYVG